RPNAEAVVVLAGKDQSLHAAGGGCAHDLLRVKFRGIKQSLALRAGTPFLIGEGIDREMDESAKLKFVPLKLAGGRHRPKWSRGFNSVCRGVKQQNCRG